MFVFVVKVFEQQTKMLFRFLFWMHGTEWPMKSLRFLFRACILIRWLLTARIFRLSQHQNVIFNFRKMWSPIRMVCFESKTKKPFTDSHEIHLLLDLFHLLNNLHIELHCWKAISFLYSSSRLITSKCSTCIFIEALSGLRVWDDDKNQTRPIQINARISWKLNIAQRKKEPLKMSKFK